MTFLLWTQLSPRLAEAARLADRGTGSLGWWADLWAGIAGIVYILLGLILLGILLAIYFFGRKGMKALHRLTREKGVPALDRARGIVEKIEARTASFPGAPNSSGGVTQIAGA